MKRFFRSVRPDALSKKSPNLWEMDKTYAKIFHSNNFSQLWPYVKRLNGKTQFKKFKKCPIVAVGKTAVALIFLVKITQF